MTASLSERWGRVGLCPGGSAFVALLTLLALGSRFLPDLAQLAVLAAVQAGGGLVGLVVLRRRRQLRAPLAVFGAAWVLYGIGVGCWWWYEAVLHRAFPYPGLPDVSFVPASVGLAIGIGVAIRRRSPGFELDAVLDSVMLAAGVAYINWTLLTEPVLQGADAAGAELVTVVYPAIGVVTVGLAARLLLLGGGSGAVWLLAGSAMVNFAGDQTYAALSRFGHYSTGAAPDQLWMLGAVLFVAAALHRDVAAVDAPRARPAAGRLRLCFAAAAMQIPVVMLVIRWANGDRVDATATGVVIVFLLPLATVRTLHLVGRLHRLARLDELTGLPSRGQLLRRMRCRAGGPDETSVLFIDLDRFKMVNDTLGHAAGDAVLRDVADRLRWLARSDDVVARLGGDEFAVLVAGGGEAAASALASRVVADLDRPFAVGGQQLYLGCSIGIAPVTAGDLARDRELPLRHADIAMFAAKAAGRARWATYTPAMTSALEDELLVDAALRRAVGAGELRLWFQPIVETDSGRTCGLEALVRWEHPERGLLMPDSFIEIAERTGSITAIGDWVIAEAMREAARLNADRPAERAVHMAVNVSARQLADPAHLLASVDRSLALTRLDPALFVVEVTETALLGDVDQAADVVRSLQARGIGTAIDDFGTGFSSLSHLGRLAVDTVKIDKSFVAGMGTRAEDATVVTAVLGLARAMGQRVVAEGVETAEQLAVLHEMGCDMAQGYHLYRPLQAVDVPAALDRWWLINDRPPRQPEADGTFDCPRLRELESTGS